LITATLSADDYIAGHRLFYRRVRKGMYIAAIVLLVIGLVVVYLDPKTWWGPMLTMGGVGGVVGNWYEDRFRLPDKVRALYGQFKGLSEPLTVTWDSEYVEGKNAEGSGRRKWRDFVRMREDEHVFLLYVTDHLWHVYPKRWFSSPDQIADFRRFASNAGET
jgi:hypothetical protein